MPTMSEAEQLLRKKRVRAGHRASATRIQGQITTTLGAVPPNAERLSTLKLALEAKQKTLKELDAEIVVLTPDEELDDEIQQADECQENIFEVLVQVGRTLTPVTAPTAPATTERTATLPPATVDRATDEPEDRGGTRPHGAKVRLPKLSLPHFNGDLMKWPTFWDSYDSAIHNNSELTDVDKFNYLRSLLERTALDAVAGLTLSAANYQEAVEILQKRFGNKPLIISKHMETLLSAEPVVSDQSLKELRQLYDRTESHLRSLKSLGVEPTSYGAMLTPVLLTKLPPELRLIVSRKISSTDLDMDNLLKTFEEELVARERASSSKTSHAPPRRTQAKQQTSALLTQSQDTQGGPVCCYCQQAHASVSCATVSDVTSRKQILRSSGRCFNCLRKGHIGRACRSSSKCQNCSARHHTSICEKTTEPAQQPPTPAKPRTELNPAAPSYQPVSTTTTLCSNKREAVLLQTACTTLHNPSEPHISLEVRLLLDSGSQRSYITERAKKLLRLEPNGEQLLAIATFGSNTGQGKVCEIVNVVMTLREYSPMPLSLYVVPTICDPLVSQPIATCIQKSDAFKGLEFADFSDGGSTLQVDVLIGCDYYWELVMGDVCKSELGPTAIQTKLGWVLSGPTLAETHTVCHATLTHVLRADTQPQETIGLEEQIRSFWELESLGIQPVEKTLYDDFACKLAFSQGRYRVALPWKEFHDVLPDHYQLSLKRLHGLMRRLRQEPAVLEQYDRTIKEQLENGIIEAVDPCEPTPNDVHYLPHHAVVRTDKSTTKLRVVYDASARSSGPSLNDCLHKGPKFNQLILDLLLRFRSFRIALTADIEKAFLMISVDDRDRDVLRFLWVDDIAKADPEIRVFRFTRVVFGVSSSPFLLNATIKYHLEKFLETNEAAVKTLLNSTYVDDVVTGANSDEAAFELYTQSKDMFRQGGFNLRKFVSNSQELQLRIDCAEGAQPTSQEMDESYAQTTLGATPTQSVGEHKILGVTWNPSTDCLIFNLTDLARLASGLQPTKRNVVSLIGKFYDPLGFLAPVTIRFKVFFQKLCRDKLEWDAHISKELIEEWNKLVSDLSEGGPVSIPRSYFHQTSGPVTSVTLCGFCDASIHAYGAVVYLVIRTDIGTSVQFIVSKTRVAPLQTQTVPRLELLSALLLSRLILSAAKSLQPTLSQMRIRCYTDSQIALYWICGTNREWKPFVRNRVNEIRRNVHPGSWSHCPGVSNPADLPSRGLTVLELTVNRLWRQGPDWLNSDLLWVEPEPCVSMPEECAVELKATALSSIVTSESLGSIGNLMTCDKYSTLPKLLRVTAYVVRAARRFKGTREDVSPTLTSEELVHAEMLWIRSAQQQLAGDKSQQKRFNLFIDDQRIWRCGGRLANAEVPVAVKYPILLSRHHPLTTLVVQEAHKRVHHNGVKETLTEVRQKFWIPKGRSVVRYLIHHCVLCRRFEGAPCKGPPPPPLPVFRLKEEPAFSYSGVDFAGPLIVRAEGAMQSQKVWICLFTCLVTRAVHLDVVTDMSTHSFIRCLKRFAARRGLPHKFVSDNGKTFKAACKYISAVFQDSTVKRYLAGLGCEWTFNVERAPWWGGVFERLIKSTKRCLRKLVARAHLSYDELLTTITEIEAVLNSRPLSYVSGEDIEEPLTPSHLLIGRRILNLPDHIGYLCELDDQEFTTDSVQLTRRVKHLNNTLNHFWNRWRTEYLNELREAHGHSMSKRHGKPTDLSIGDVVIVHNEKLPRGLWKLGRIIELLKGRDGHFRAAIVKTTRTDGQSMLLRRPIQLLYPLELSESSRISTKKGTSPNTIVDDSEPSMEEAAIPNLRRSKRAAAQQGDDRRKACMYELNDD